MGDMSSKKLLKLPRVFANAYTNRIFAGAYVKPHRAPATLVLDGTASPHADFDLSACGFFAQDVDAAGLTALSQYPDTSVLEGRIAAFHGVDADHVFVTAGADEAIDRLCRCYLTPWQDQHGAGSLVITRPTFEMFKRYAVLSGGQVKEVDWPAGAPFPVESFCAAPDDTTRMAAVVTPNNPTGTVVPEETLRILFEKTKDIIFLLDLAYVDFTEFDPTKMALEYEHVLVLRSFSKGWGLPGLRLGYVLGHPAALGILRQAGGPYSVSRASLSIAETLFPQQKDRFLKSAATVVQERVQLETLLREWGLDVPASGANYVFVTLTSAFLNRGLDAQKVQDILAKQGILIRHFANRPEIAQGLRITLPGEPHKFQKLLGALKEIFLS